MKRLDVHPERTVSTRQPVLDNERGMLLVLVLLVLLVVSALASASLINAFLERSLATNQNYASIALQAADGGIATGAAWLKDNPPSDATLNALAASAVLPPLYLDTLATFTTNPVLTRTLSVTPTGSQESIAGRFEVTIRLKREWRDYNGNGRVDSWEDSGYKDGDGVPDDGTNGAGMSLLGDVVLYNKCLPPLNDCFGFPDSRFSGNVGDRGYPVVEIASKGFAGTAESNAASVREVVLDVAKNKLNAIGVKGGVTAKGSVHIQGTPDIHGENFNEAGTAPDPSCADMPGAYVESGQTATSGGSAAYHGSPPTVINPPCLPGPEPNCTTPNGHQTLLSNPWDVLGITQAEMPAPVSAAVADVMLMDPNSLGEIVYVTDASYSPPNNAKGILIVHNPAGTATYAMTGNNKFTGLIIADVVIMHGTADIVGAVISMSTALVDASHGTPKVKYSCSAINAVTKQSFSSKLGWHRLR